MVMMVMVMMMVMVLLRRIQVCGEPRRSFHISDGESRLGIRIE